MSALHAQHTVEWGYQVHVWLTCTAYRKVGLSGACLPYTVHAQHAVEWSYHTVEWSSLHAQHAVKWCYQAHVCLTCTWSGVIRRMSALHALDQMLSGTCLLFSTHCLLGTLSLFDKNLFRPLNKKLMATNYMYIHFLWLLLLPFVKNNLCTQVISMYQLFLTKKSCQRFDQMLQSSSGKKWSVRVALEDFIVCTLEPQ